MERELNSRSLARVFNPTANSLNAIRLALATVVILSHSWPVTGAGEDPLLGGQDWGDWAVGGFFAISGYLITASRDTTAQLRVFAWKRFLRIYPGYFCALLAVAFIAAPLSTVFTGEPWRATDSLGYVWRNLTLLITTPGIGSTLTDSPVANSWNNPLWTLAYETACYALIGLTFTVIPPKFRLATVIVAGVACSIFLVLASGGLILIPVVVIKGLQLGAYFAAGAFLYLGRSRITMRWPLLLTVALFLGITIALKIDAIFAPLPLALLLMWAGVKLPLQRLGASNDLSYGTYIYGFPVQQLIHIALPTVNGPLLFALMSVVATLPLAWLSYRFVERPALKYKSLQITRLREKAG